MSLGLALIPVSVLGASVPNFPPNPVGEGLYRGQLFHGALLPITIIACALLAACIVHIVARKTQKPHSLK
jgi:hypothetical protein